MRSIDTRNVPAFSQNLLAVSVILIAKTAVTLVLCFFASNFMVAELAALALAGALVVLAVRRGAFALAPADDADAPETTIPAEYAASIRTIALPLVGLFLCEATQGMGWAARMFGAYSDVIQTTESIVFVQCGVLLGALVLIAVRDRVGNFVNFHYFVILGSLLLLVVPWLCADISGGILVFITAFPWGISTSLLVAAILVNAMNTPGRVLWLMLATVAACFALAFAVGGLGLALLGNAVANAIWRIMLVVAIAAAALEILREYQHLESELEKQSQRTERDAFDGYGLTAREKEVLTLTLQGRGSQWIAQKLYISDNTVRSHIKHIYQKCGVHNRDELIDLLSGE